MQHIHSLTGLRGLAAMLVFISHSANDGFLPVYVGDGFGQTGVMLFLF
jgi:peptidoglycan/LPS O-acetylase OafA/YrhL